MSNNVSLVDPRSMPWEVIPYQFTEVSDVVWYAVRVYPPVSFASRDVCSCFASYNSERGRQQVPNSHAY